MANTRLSRSRLRLSKILLVIGAPGFVLSVALQYDALIGISFIILVVGVLLGKNRTVCPSCGKAHLSIGVEVLHCHSCGAPYFEARTDEPVA
jgi:hypothetical protein